MAKKKAPKSIHVQLDPGNDEICERRALESFRNNRTAYINALVLEDGKKNPEKK